ncbi:MAG TPA: HAD hydrolase-like protein [Planctomycetota bacterium]|nr:HAD hydrolase-like protein [Planctomycetota bacterium]
MSADPQAALRDFKPRHQFFVGIDSDGCAFDTMEVKHKDCFCPMFVKHYRLAAVAKYAREAWDFVNLYSKTRGCNRFHAVLHSLDLLRDRAEVRARGVEVAEARGLRDWVKRESKLGNPALEAAVKSGGDPDLATALAWSKDVNRLVGEIVEDVPPFPFVRESLAKLSTRADIICVSATPGEALEREWAEHDIARYAAVIAGQEMGTKKDHLRLAAVGKYPAGSVLMVGDAPGDMDAARAVGALYYPINPGGEEASWKRFFDEAADRFLAGSYAGAYEDALVAEFRKRLPETPPWKSAAGR